MSLAEAANTNPKAIYSYINSKTHLRDHIRALKSPRSSGVITDPLSIANCLNDYFCSVFVQEKVDDMPHFASRTATTCPDPSLDVASVSYKLRLLRPNKTPGPDGVHPRVLRECADAFAVPLGIIFRMSYDTSDVPRQWRAANVTAIYKNKGDRLDPSNYRPISLTSAVCKIFESLVTSVLTRHLASGNLINPAQHGFVPR